MTIHPPSLAGARVRLPWLGRLAPAMLVGFALAGSLWFGLIPAVMRLHAQHRLLGGTFDPRLVDAGMLALNAILLMSFVAVHRFRRSRQRGASNPNEASE